MVKTHIEHDGAGYLLVPSGPGIGVEFNPDSVHTVPDYPRRIQLRRGMDGAIVDQ